MSGIWNAEGSLEVDVGQRYFVAIWNEGQQINPGQVLPVVLGKGMVLPLTIGAERFKDRIIFESVSEDIGAYALQGLKWVDSKNHAAPPPTP